MQQELENTTAVDLHCRQLATLPDKQQRNLQTHHLPSYSYEYCVEFVSELDGARETNTIIQYSRNRVLSTVSNRTDTEGIY